MPTDIEDEVVSQQIEELDFNPPCEAHLRIAFLMVDIPLRRCKREAEWIAVFPCCQGNRVFCNKCKTETAIPFEHCKRRWFYDWIGWCRI